MKLEKNTFLDNPIPPLNFDPNPVTEVIINDEKVTYNACSFDTSLEQAVKSYPNHKYIGSGYEFFVDGKKHTYPFIIHFFI